MISDQYVWLIWSSAFLIPWALVYKAYPRYRHAMLWSSLFTMPMGLTEPLFVPEYWSPPSLFNLAINTGFDIESLIFCFGIGGIAAVLYKLIDNNRFHRIAEVDKFQPLHRHHYKALLAPFISFPVFYFLFNWNPIYPGIVAMFIGALANVLCRPDLAKKTWFGALLSHS